VRGFAERSWGCRTRALGRPRASCTSRDKAEGCSGGPEARSLRRACSAVEAPEGRRATLFFWLLSYRY
jgi:hypothetical protein